MVDVTQEENKKIGISFILNLNHANKIKEKHFKTEKTKKTLRIRIAKRDKTMNSNDKLCKNKFNIQFLMQENKARQKKKFYNQRNEVFMLITATKMKGMTPRTIFSILLRKYNF